MTQETLPAEDPKPTAGEAAIALQAKESVADVVELEREVNKGNANEDGWEAQIETCIKRGLEKYDGDFYVVVLNKKERLLHNVIRRYFLDRQSCPTPEYDQTVFRFVRSCHSLEYLWTVPDIEACQDLSANKDNLSGELKTLGAMVDQFLDGALDRECERRNREAEEVR